MTTPRIAGITMVRNELDILPYTLAHLAPQVDVILVLDHGSTDGTRDYLASTPALGDTPIHVEDLTEPGYYQSRFMTYLAHKAAAEHHAEWIVPFDADEAWYLPDRLDLDGLPAVFLRSWWHVPHVGADDTDEPDPIRRIVWRQPEQQAMSKIMFRWRPDAVIEQGNHTISLPPGVDLGWTRRAAWGHTLPNSYEAFTAGEIRHYPFRSLDQIRSKFGQGVAALDAAPSLPSGYCAHWRQLAAFDARGALETWWLELQDSATVHAPPEVTWTGWS